MSLLRKWRRWFFCEHDWKNVGTFEVSTIFNAPDHVGGIIYVKECAKCHRIWKQSMP
jgi:hypothetical protein